MFQGWNYTLEEVKANVEMADIGALYTTDDGATRLEIEIAEREVVKVSFSQTKAEGVSIDWGFGKSERSAAVAGDACTSYAYEQPGRYTVTLTVDKDCEITLGANGSPLICTDYVETDGAAHNTLRNAYIGDRVTKFNKSAFLNHYALHSISMNKGVIALGDRSFDSSSIEFIAIPSGIDTIPYNAFDTCRCLKSISLPVSVQNLEQNSIYQCDVLKRLNLKHITNPQTSAVAYDGVISEISVNADIAYIPNDFCKACLGLERISFLGKVKIFYSGALSYCYNLKTVDLTHCSAVPTLQDTAILSHHGSDLKILVPAALAEEWRQATNWTQLAKYIKGV